MSTYSRTRPGCAESTRHFSPRNAASGTEWVTNMIVVPVSRQNPQQLLVELVAGELVQCAEGFVHQQHPGPAHERAGDGHPLAHPPRQFVRQGVFASLQGRPAPAAPPAPRTGRGRRRAGRPPAAGARCRGRCARAAGWRPGRRRRSRGPDGPVPACGRRPGSCRRRSGPGRRRPEAAWTCRSPRGPSMVTRPPSGTSKPTLSRAVTPPAGAPRNGPSGRPRKWPCVAGGGRCNDVRRPRCRSHRRDRGHPKSVSSAIRLPPGCPWS